MFGFQGIDGQSIASAALAFNGTGVADIRQIRLDEITLTTAVPEPATWALMIGGFGMVGGTMRRRKPTVSVTYA